jgi:hypothetical protein
MGNKEATPNVNVTLDHPSPNAGTQPVDSFPCPLCGSPIPIRLTLKKQKPYCQCLSCMLQIFFRGKVAIERLRRLIDSGILVSGDNSPSDMAFTLYNRIQMLNLQVKQLKEKRSLFIANEDLENLISVFENEITRLQDNLKLSAHNPSRNK